MACHLSPVKLLLEPLLTASTKFLETNHNETGLEIQTILIKNIIWKQQLQNLMNFVQRAKPQSPYIQLGTKTL